MKKIAIILLNYSSAPETQECVKSLKKISHPNFDYKIIIVNNSPDDTEELQNNLKGDSIEIIDSKVNTGFSGGNNIGISHALANDYDYMLILNNDTLVKKDFLTQLQETYEKEKNTGIVVPKIYFAKGHEYHKNRYKEDELGSVIWYAGGILDWKNVLGVHKGVDEVDAGQFDTLEETDYATGACMLLSRELIEKIGMFDEDYFLYYEDSDLSIRAKKKGYKVLFQPSSIIWHKNAASSGGSGSQLQDYYTTRNRLLFGKKYAPIRSKVALLKEGISLIKNGREYQKKGAKDFFKGKFGKADFQTE